MREKHCFRIGRNRPTSNFAGTEAQRIDDQQKLLKAMGFEIANVHLGSASRKELTAALKQFLLEAFTQAGSGMLQVVEQDYGAWKRHWQECENRL